MNMNIAGTIARELGIRPQQAEAAIRLLGEGCTVPFIARYRKEATGSLSDEQLRNLETRLDFLMKLNEAREKARLYLEEAGVMNQPLSAQIDGAETMTALDDILRPYRKKKKTRAGLAREKGLEELAEHILKQASGADPASYAASFINDGKGVPSAEAALDGALDILAERIADDPAFTAWIREKTWKNGRIASEAKDEKEASVYENYYHFEEDIKRISGYRVLAINRGEKEKFLRVNLKAPAEDILEYLKRRVLKSRGTKTAVLLERMLRDSYERLLAPRIERDIRKELTEKAEDDAIRMFGRNLSQLLLIPPVSGCSVLGWDPAFRTGCKLAAVDPTGKILDTAVIFPTAPTNETKKKEAAEVLSRMIKKHGINLISVGNGTASRESEQFIADFLKGIPENVSYVITNEAGASVYSASPLATEEFPDLDVGFRSAASIARRVQDPLAELVKIDPKAIGVGQYQHDMDQKKLDMALTAVVEDCVNHVGVELNTASPSLLARVSGLTKTAAKNIVSYREKHGRFMKRSELLKVPQLGPKAYELSAGFLRISDGDDLLDRTGVHPESYKAAYHLMEDLGITAEEILKGSRSVSVKESASYAARYGIGEPTLMDIIKELNAPGRDPREDLPKVMLRHDVMEITDLKPGMKLMGTVRNIVDFGAFVDIGVHEDGLVHISEMSKDRFVRSPMDIVRVGDVVSVTVLSADPVKKRIALSMKR